MQKHWRIKGLIQKVLSCTPGGTLVNDQLQRTFGGLKDFEGTVDSKVIDDWLVLIDLMRDLGISAADRDCVEVGTGWFPTFPVCFSLIGSKTITTYDLHRHLHRRMTFDMLRRLSVHLDLISRTSGLSPRAIETAHADLCSSDDLKDLLRKARIEYHAPANAAQTQLRDASIDIAFSNSVLEHVEPQAIDAIMRETRRILRPGGMAIHSVNCGDHYAYFDSGISAINYLQYSEAGWAFWNNSLLYQNRLRPSDFFAAPKQQA